MKINSTFKNILAGFSFFAGSFLMAQESSPLIIEQINPKLFVHTTFNEFGGVKYAANGLYLITKKGVVIFDTPWDKEEYQGLLDAIEEKHHLPVIAVFASHWHDDRAGGFDYYNKKGIPTYATQQTNAILKEKNLATANNEIVLNKKYKIGGEQFVIEYFGEGHTVDNTVVWFPKYKFLNGGCLIKSADAKNIGFIGDGNVKAWPETIQKLEKEHPQIIKVIPGHDDWKNGDHLKRTKELIN